MKRAQRARGCNAAARERRALERWHLEDRALALGARGSLDDEDTGRSRHLRNMAYRHLRTDLGINLVTVLSIGTVLLVFARLRRDGTKHIGKESVEGRIKEGHHLRVKQTAEGGAAREEEEEGRPICGGLVQHFTIR